MKFEKTPFVISRPNRFSLEISLKDSEKKLKTIIYGRESLIHPYNDGEDWYLLEAQQKSTQITVYKLNKDTLEKRNTIDFDRIDSISEIYIPRGLFLNTGQERKNIGVIYDIYFDNQEESEKYESDNYEDTDINSDEQPLFLQLQKEKKDGDFIKYAEYILVKVGTITNGLRLFCVKINPNITDYQIIDVNINLDDQSLRSSIRSLDFSDEKTFDRFLVNSIYSPNKNTQLRPYIIVLDKNSKDKETVIKFIKRIENSTQVMISDHATIDIYFEYSEDNFKKLIYRLNTKNIGSLYAGEHIKSLV